MSEVARDKPIECKNHIIHVVGSFESDEEIDSGAVQGQELERDPLRLTLGDMIACCRYDDVREALALNPATPTHLLEQLARESAGKVILALAINPSTPQHVLNTLCQRALQGDLKDIATDADSLLHGMEYSFANRLRYYLSTNPNAPRYFMRHSGSEYDVNVRAALAINPCLPGHLMSILLRDISPVVRREIASRSDLTERQIKKLAEDRDPMVLCSLISNPRTPYVVRIKFAHHENHFVAKAVRDFNSGIPNDSSDELMRIQNTSWRHVFRSYVDVPKLLRARISRQSEIIPSDEDYRNFRRAVLQKHKLTQVDWLALAENPGTEFDAQLGDIRDLENLQDIKGEWTTLDFLAKYYATPEHILLSLIECDSPYTRALAVERLSSTIDDQDILRKISQDEHAIVRIALAKGAGKNLADQIWAILATDNDSEVQQAVWDNLDAPTSARATLSLNGFSARKV